MAPETETFCARCGTSLAPGAYFCLRCGTSVPVAPSGASATGAPPVRRPLPAQHNAQLDALRKATLGEYEVLAELGRGGMATVYLAHDLALDRKVAIKVLAPALLLMGEGMVERFKREARTAAALSHPHIIPIYAVKESEHVLYFVMKYVQGRALDTVIRDVGTLAIPMVQTILAQVGDALGYAHRHGVIHRDIKSANIMLDEDGRAVVTDFGIAKVVQAEGLTMTGVTVGTPTYMSPEQCATRDVTGASDQYSLGVVAYEMLTGRLPFQANSTMSVMYAHFNERPRPVAELRPDCPPNLAAGVMRMLEKDPAQRWPSMDDIVAVCGRPSLRHDDPVRGEMITLAKAAPGSCGYSARARRSGPGADARGAAARAGARAVRAARCGCRIGDAHRGRAAQRQRAALAPGAGHRRNEPRGRGRSDSRRAREGGHRVQGSGLARGPEPVARGDGPARHRRLSLGGRRAPVAGARGARHPAAPRRGAAGRARRRGARSRRPAAGHPEGDRRLRARARIARRRPGAAGVSGAHVGAATELAGFLRIRAQSQGRPDGHGRASLGPHGRSDRERRLRVRQRHHGPGRAAAGDVPGGPRGGLKRLAAHHDSLAGAGRVLKKHGDLGVEFPIL